MRSFGAVRLEGDGQIIVPAATRVKVLNANYTPAFQVYDLFDSGAEIHIQDDGRTIKIFPLRREEY